MKNMLTSWMSLENWHILAWKRIKRIPIFILLFFISFTDTLTNILTHTPNIIYIHIDYQQQYTTHIKSYILYSIHIVRDQ